MRTYCFTFLLLLAFATAGAQTTVSATDILRQVAAGEDVRLNGVTITGDLDFTRLPERRSTQKGYGGSQQHWTYPIRVALTFVDCTFAGDVWGFRIEQKDKDYKGGQAHKAEFHEDVLFRGCRFEEDVNFKYSTFLADADFPAARFEEYAGFKYTKFSDDADFSEIEVDGDANFKYTEFAGAVDMSDAVFGDLAEFKYTDFEDRVTFANAVFRDDAVFKYVKFPAGVDMTKARFERDADFKYAKFRRPAVFEGTDWGRDADFKYTQLDGKPFRGGE